MTPSRLQKKCSISSEFIPIHYECFGIFRKGCSLESSSALRRPHEPPLDPGAFKRINQTCGFSRLCELPPELLGIIQIYSRHASRWRAVSALRMATLVSVTNSECVAQMPLGDIMSS
ncbi:hypothetical protein F4779DRAFT_45346 [Xylariaceae sp. FL0662B]|nr:hypothetical protein F4779DRAFT_45346 [Xylariaceae sp. FL0662B]